MANLRISSGTIARTVILALALVNQSLTILGYKIIPIEDQQISDFVSLLFTMGSSIAAWWKNNSFSRAALEADAHMKALKK